MKKKKVLMLAAALSVGAVAGAAIVNSVADTGLTKVPVSRAPATPIEAPENKGMFYPGNTIYMEFYVGEGNHWWKNDNSPYYFYFYVNWDDASVEGGQNGASVWSDPLTHDYTDATTSVWETLVPTLPSNAPETVTHWDGVIATRMNPNPGEDKPNPDWDNQWGQTLDVKYGGEDCQGTPATISTQNTIKVWDDNQVNDKDTPDHGKCRFGVGDTDFSVTIEAWAKTTGWYGDGENNEANICKQDGTTDKVELTKRWNASAETFAELGIDVQSYFSKYEIAGEGSDPEVDAIAAKYQLILNRYADLADFARRA